VQELQARFKMMELVAALAEPEDCRRPLAGFGALRVGMWTEIAQLRLFATE
jgi:hypothetical protein